MVALPEDFDVRGSFVTVDAIASQPAFAGRVLAEGADHVIALKRTGKRAMCNCTTGSWPWLPRCLAG